MSDTILSPELSPHDRQSNVKQNKATIVIDRVIIKHLINNKIKYHTLTVMFKQIIIEKYQMVVHKIQLQKNY